MRPVVQGQSGERAPERAVHQRRAAPVEPVHAADAFGAGRQGVGLLGKFAEAALAQHGPQPVEGVAHGRLAGLVAVIARQNAVGHHAGDARHKDFCPALSMWQLLVPITMTIVPGSATPAPGTPAWASMIAALTGIPGGRPIFLAIRASNSPAHWPGAGAGRAFSSATTSAIFGCSAAKNAREG